MDVERGFIESQDRDEAMLAIITGNVKLLENANELDYEEFLKCAAFCGLNMFRNVKDMPATDRIETLLAVYVGPGIEDMTSADRLRAAVKKTLSKGLERFDPDADLEAAERSAIPDELIKEWNKMNLDDCLWQGGHSAVVPTTRLQT